MISSFISATKSYERLSRLMGAYTTYHVMSVKGTVEGMSDERTETATA